MEDDVDLVLARLLAEQDIAATLLRYARGVDLVDVAMIRSVFWEDAVADYGDMFSGTGWGFADFIAQVHPSMQVTVHRVSGISSVVDGDQAGSESLVHMRARIVDGEGGSTELSSYGRYVDRWRRQDGAWRITHRQYVHALDETWPTQTTLFPPVAPRDASDPSYVVLGPRQ